ncbi:acylphosphatase [Oceanobacillus saliphilus]|uniref:acylphosphatase n=1 Tax=Oceanobacillus saliphilus TaxID=2925834 RepID=UPI00201E22C3|nr:acylphosphatase [Oceanobacillus saliphilus]
MDEIDFKWMPHHEGAVPPAGQGKRISTYTVALEAWRRGLNVQFYSVFDDENSLKVRYSIGNENRVHHFSLSMGDKVTQEAFDVCANKELTKQYLSKAGVPVPEGRMFNENSDEEEIINFAKTMRFPVVLKPTDGNAGKGVFANIQSIDELRGIIPYVRGVLGFKEIIVENYIPGDEFRICVIEDRLLGAMNRRPASILGDGKHSVKQLIDQINQIRKMNPHLTSRLIKKDREVITMLERKGYNMNSIPADGERVFLREKSNLSAGGDAIDVTDELTQNVKNIAINAGKAIPGLFHYGVDMIVDKENDTGVILEVNARPGIGGHLFPMEGKPRDFAKEIIDYYFPETKNDVRSWLFFDFDTVLEPIKNRSAASVQLTPPPNGNIHGKKYIISGKVQVVGYRAWIKRQALLMNLHGYAENLDDGTVLVVVAGTDKEVVEDFKSICFKGPEKAVVENVEQSDWNKPVKIGFDIIQKDYKLTPFDLQRAEKEKERIVQEKEKIEREKDRLNKKYQRVTTSKSWKYTYPLRRMIELLKK